MKLQPQIGASDYQIILRHDFMSFVEAGFHELHAEIPFVPGPHIELIAAKLEACMRGEIRRLIINLPPRNLKSHCVSVAFPAYVLGRVPAKRIICVSYGQDLADLHARETRALMSSAWYGSIFPGCRLASEGLENLVTTRGGNRLSTSVGGRVTGMGGDIIIIDDPIKPEEALSDSARQKVNDWYSSTLVSRLNDKKTGCVIIVMQRLHEDDLVGYLLQREDWEVISFPAIMEEDRSYRIKTALGQRTVTWKRGGALHPAREPLDILMNIRDRVGEYNFKSQYQQCPISLEGNIVKLAWLKNRYDTTPPFDRIIQSWDTANKGGERNDYSACTTWGVKGTINYLLNVYRAHLEFPALKEKLIELALRWKPRIILVEDKASGTPLVQEMQGSRLNVLAHKLPPGTDKVMRLHTQSAAFYEGRVRLPKEAPWLDDYLAELTGFPGRKFDDQVDSTTQFLNYISNAPAPLIFGRETIARMSRPSLYPRTWPKRTMPWIF